MSAIQGEDDINRFCVFNLSRNVAESIESLSPVEKLLVAAGALGKTDTKGNAAYEAVRKLTTWRNAFAHGHCVDRPTKSLRHNHLIPPPQYPGVADAIVKMKELVRCYVRLHDYLCSISVNPYTSGPSSEAEDVRKYLGDIDRFQFYASEDSNDIYVIAKKGA